MSVVKEIIATRGIKNFNASRAVPVMAKIFINSVCNLRCGFCEIGAKDASEGASVHLPFEKMKEIIQYLKDWDVHCIYITGGEPFLHPDLWRIFKLGKGLHGAQCQSIALQMTMALMRAVRIV